MGAPSPETGGLHVRQAKKERRDTARALGGGGEGSRDHQALPASMACPALCLAAAESGKTLSPPPKSRVLL